MPWLVAGDFNEIRAMVEKEGRLFRNPRQMVAFREVLSDCSLQDLGFQGAEFTWNNNCEYTAFVHERLDRGVANSDWMVWFPRVVVCHNSFASSDHMGILIDLMPMPPMNQRKQRKLFHFDHTCLREEGCEPVINAAWNKKQFGTPLYQLTQKIKQCRIDLLLWSQSHTRVTTKIIQEKKA